MHVVHACMHARADDALQTHICTHTRMHTLQCIHTLYTYIPHALHISHIHIYIRTLHTCLHASHVHAYLIYIYTLRAHIACIHYILAYIHTLHMCMHARITFQTYNAQIHCILDLHALHLCMPRWIHCTHACVTRTYVAYNAGMHQSTTHNTTSHYILDINTTHTYISAQTCMHGYKHCIYPMCPHIQTLHACMHDTHE